MVKYLLGTHITFLGIGPSRFPLCNATPESIDHLFINFPYLLDTWNFVSRYYGVQFIWRGEILDEDFHSWSNHVNLLRMKSHATHYELGSMDDLE